MATKKSTKKTIKKNTKKKKNPTLKQIKAREKGQKALKKYLDNKFGSSQKSTKVKKNISVPQQIIREKEIIVKQPTHTTVQQKTINFQFSLFKKLLGIEVLPIKLNENKDKSSIKEVIYYILRKLRLLSVRTQMNRDKIKEIINYTNNEIKKIKSEIKKQDKKIKVLEKENKELKEKFENE